MYVIALLVKGQEVFCVIPPMPSATTQHGRMNSATSANIRRCFAYVLRRIVVPQLPQMAYS